MFAALLAFLVGVLLIQAGVSLLVIDHKLGRFQKRLNGKAG